MDIEKIFGVENPHYLKTKHNIAQVVLQMGQNKKALNELNECLIIQEKILGV